MAGQTIGERIKAIREERGERQPDFAAALNAAAKRLRIVVNYDGSKISKLEGNKQFTTLEDVLVIAQLDKQGRGRDWLAWGDSAVSLADRPHPPTIVSNDVLMTTDPYSVAQRRVAGARTPGKRGRGR